MSNAGKQLCLGIELINDPNWMGGTLYLQNLVICLSRLPANERPQIRLLGAQEVLADFEQKCAPLAAVQSYKISLWQRLLQRFGWNFSAHCTIDILYPGFGAAIDGAKTIHWIPDFQHRYLPQLFSDAEIAARDKSIARLAAIPGVVVLSSEVAARDFSYFYPEHKAVAKVWHFCSLLDSSAVSDFNPCKHYHLPEKYLYLPNQFWAHKNHIIVFKALRTLRDQHGIHIPLVCTGAQADRRNKSHFSSLMQFIKDNDLAEQISLLGLIDRQQQLAVFRYAAAVIQPSLFEGWSTVVEDVRAIGRPVFLSDIPVHREQKPQHCHYFNAESEDALVALLLAQWQQLQPGPDKKAEQAAADDLHHRILASGRTFMQIIHRADNII